jgi:hypothetical protein
MPSILFAQSKESLSYEFYASALKICSLLNSNNSHKDVGFVAAIYFLCVSSLEAFINESFVIDNNMEKYDKNFLTCEENRKYEKIRKINRTKIGIYCKLKKYPKILFSLKLEKSLEREIEVLINLRNECIGHFKYTLLPSVLQENNLNNDISNFCHLDPTTPLYSGWPRNVLNYEGAKTALKATYSYVYMFYNVDKIKEIVDLKLNRIFQDPEKTSLKISTLATNVYNFKTLYESQLKN